MEETCDENSLSMQIEIEKSIQQVLDTQEDDENFLANNLFFNDDNSNQIVLTKKAQQRAKHK